MNNITTLESVFQRVDTMFQTCHDSLIPVKDISFDDLDTIKIGNNLHPLKPIAQRSIAWRLGMPFKKISAAKRVQGIGAKDGKADQGNRKVRESASEKGRHQETQSRKGENKIDGGQETSQKEAREEEGQIRITEKNILSKIIAIILGVAATGIFAWKFKGTFLHL